VCVIKVAVSEVEAAEEQACDDNKV
jgi:hypothetical protein